MTYPDRRRASRAACAAAFGIVAFAATAHANPVVMTGGWVADFSPAMRVSADSSATVFEFQGSYKLSGAGRADVYLLTTCIGMETATREAGGKTLTTGSGRCELKDASGDKLVAAMETAFDGFTLNIDGGTGKWASARGTLVSKESFTLESERQLKGYSNATGDLRHE